MEETKDKEKKQEKENEVKFAKPVSFEYKVHYLQMKRKKRKKDEQE